MSDDRYEQRFMGGDEATFREKHVSRVFVALMAVPALAALVLAIFTAIAAGPVAAIAPAVAALFVTLVTLYFAAMRITVTPTHIEIRYGTMGPSIPISAVTSVTEGELDALTRLAFGPKWQGPRRWSYVPPGVRRAVRVEWDDAGKKAWAQIGASDAPALARAIERARQGKSPAVRVEDESEPLEETVAARGAKRAARV
jgi:hypothetical protein